ncbi:MAG: tetratricopeptide repeat protein [Rhodoblastus sp.]
MAFSECLRVNDQARPSWRAVRAAACLTAACLLAAPAADAQSLWYKPPPYRHVERAYQGDPRAQAWLGYLYDKGIGVPQNYEKAVYWWHCAADRGQPHAQFLLGMAHDLGRGAPQDYVLAYAWTNQAVARAQGRLRADWARMRDAIASKLSLKEKTDAQRLTIDDLRGPDCRAANIVKGG